MNTTPGAGWYDDGSGRQRWWDGGQWTEHFAPGAAHAQSITPESGPDLSAPQPGVIAPGAPEQTYATSSYSAFAAPAASGSPAGVSPYENPGATAPKKTPSVVGIIGLAAAVLGFVLACIPITFIVGWILLPIGFILSIVAFFLKGAKWPAIVGVCVAVVGTIVAIVVFFVLLFSTASAFSDDLISITESELDSAAPSATPDDSDSADDPRGTPVALGSTISGEEYDVVVNSITFDADDEVMSANPFNEAPDAGYAYAVVNVSVTYTGADSGFAALAQIDYVSGGGEVISSIDSPAVPPEPALGFDTLTTGTTATGNIVLEVPIGDDGLLRVTPGLFDDEVFVELR